MSRNKTRIVLESLSPEERDRLGLETEKLIQNEMSYIVNHYIYRYQHAAANTLGWDRDDLLNHIRMILYTGVVTFSPDKNVKITSYLSTILYYQMGNLSIKIQNKKNSNTKMVFVETMYESEDMIDYTTSEDWMAYAVKFEKVIDYLNETEKKLLVYHLVYGHTMTELESKLDASKVEIVRSLKTLKAKIEDIQ